MPNAAMKVIYMIGFVAGCAIRGYHVKRTGRNRAERAGIPWYEWLMLVLVVVGMQVLPLLYVFSPWLGFADYRHSTPVGVVAGVSGAAVFAAANYLLWRSHVDLGKNFSIALRVREDHCLVTSGIFGYVRHPMYAAHWLWAIAQALLLQNWLAGPVFLVAFLPLYLSRVPREERMMIDRFGDEYRAYMDRTGRLLPRFGRMG